LGFFIFLSKISKYVCPKYKVWSSFLPENSAIFVEAAFQVVISKFVVSFPVKKGDCFLVRGGFRPVEFKVVQVEVKDAEEDICIVAPETVRTATPN